MKTLARGSAHAAGYAGAARALSAVSARTGRGEGHDEIPTSTVDQPGMDSAAEGWPVAGNFRGATGMAWSPCSALSLAALLHGGERLPALLSGVPAPDGACARVSTKAG
jgi:hypothetical protein